MKKITIITLGFLGLFLINSCSGLKVVSDVDPMVDFTKFKTFEYYGWADESDQILTRLDKERIEKAFGEEFSKRGMEYVEENGDVIVTLFIVVEDKTTKTAQTTTMGGGYGGYYGGYYGAGPGYGWGGGHSTTTIQEYDYRVGTLVCDVFDAEKKELIWESIGRKEINENPAKRETSTPKTVAAIMSKYPVAPIK